MPDRSTIPSLHDLLRRRVFWAWVTSSLIGINCLVFLAMLASGADPWHSSTGIPLAWGANFGPATQDGEWWRLGSAMFLHFGVVHLALNMWALWDGGQLVERMFGPFRFAVIYLLSGVTGNLLSLVNHHGQAVSGGASGAIFGVYGALLVCLWRERRLLHPAEFRWLFWGASGFSVVTIVFGLMIPGIDNAAHIGGFLTGLLSGFGLAHALEADRSLPWRPRLLAVASYAFGLLLLVSLIPVPTYHWHDEAQARREIQSFLQSDATISQTWKDILEEGRRDGASFEELAGRIDTAIGDPYEKSFEHLSELAANPALPSASTLDMLRYYAGLRRDASRSLADGLRSNNPRKIHNAMALERKANGLRRPGLAPP